MPRIQTQEDGYEYRVKRIFKRLHEQFCNEKQGGTFHDWLNKNPKTVGNEFLDDVETYCGLPDFEDDADETH